ncbi:MAG: chromosome segregation protein SMC [Fimbriimonadaceae bacterium]|nr:chromosome segregation protein SMC [Fimbriimonadaceae bacterium]
MRLKRLELVGFKTFAEATVLDFGPGVTAIIGPNGSGKSNCADALLWVLAERRLSALRASEAADVIFAGSEQRRPTGFAEVTLTVDNSAGTLPIALTEVSVCRRAYRNGEQEYLLNGRRCRRRDIVDLFLDTGVGRHSFTVISQREIDALLSLDPVDRRRLLEEVAGIERYRARRDETLGRLGEVNTNLTRLGDLMQGLALQLEPLQAQRLVAERFLALRHRALELRLGLAVKDYQLTARRAARGRDEQQQQQTALQAAEATLAAAEASEGAARLDQQRLEQELRAAQEELGETARQAEQQVGRLQLAEQQAAHLAQRLDETRAGAARQAATLARLAGGAADRAAEEDALAAELDGAAAALAEVQQRSEAQQAAEQGEAQAAAQERAAHHELTRQVSALEGEVSAARAALQRAVTRRTELASRQSAAAAHLATASSAAATAEAALETVQASLAAGRGGEQEQVEALRESDRQRTALQAQIAERQGRLTEATTRLQLLRAAIDSYEGLYRGVRAVLQARDRGRLRGDYQVVADLLRVADGCEVAVDALLGARLQDLVCETAEDARAAVEFLKQDRSGRATFLPLDLLEYAEGPRQGDRLRALPGVVGLGLDLVQTAPEFDLARRLLVANLVVVETIEAGIAVRRAGFERVSIVSLDGDVIRTSGAITGGSRERGGPNLLEQRSEVAARDREADRLDAELAALRGDLHALDRQQRGAREQLEAARRELEQQRQQMAAAERRRLDARAALAQASGEPARLAAAVGETTREAEELGARIRRAEAAQTAATAERDAVATRLAAAEQIAAAARRQSEAEQAEVAGARVQVAEVTGRLQAVRAAAAAERRAQAASLAEQQRLTAAAGALERELQRAGDEVQTQREALESWRASHGAAVAAVAARRTMREDADGLVAAAVQRARAAREAVVEAREGLHRVELRQAAVDAEREQLRQTLSEEFGGLTPEAAEQRAIEIPNRQEAAEELAMLRAEMTALGDVNLGAVEECERLGGQLEFYEQQRTDLETARGDLLRVIEEIDELTVGRLATAYEAVNREFGALFQRIFGPSGEARLSWCDPRAILESGLEVMVRLPGKRLQSILLLSGGERAMTTVTLLLAMFKVKPSPFCLLDELDAPLDEANLRKYRELLREFSRESQFIVITHNPETTRAADLLYGITMPEPGVSRAFSYRPPAEDEDRPDGTVRAAD